MLLSINQSAGDDPKKQLQKVWLVSHGSLNLALEHEKRLLDLEGTTHTTSKPVMVTPQWIERSLQVYYFLLFLLKRKYIFIYMLLLFFEKNNQKSHSRQNK